MTNPNLTENEFTADLGLDLLLSDMAAPEMPS